ncbi:MAG: Hint domain-containing protein [Thalassovita sp.]
MPLTITAEDAEFALSTGRNLYSGRGTSKFDGSPSDSTGLVIRANDGDDEARLFEVGDSYDISWDGGTLGDAVVIRSDGQADKYGIVVFEGRDAEGDLTQVLWTPDFNLDHWYDSNTARGARCSFYNSDKQKYDYDMLCFDARTKISTPSGWRRAGDLRVGDHVLTRDGGAQPLQWVGGAVCVGAGALTPVTVQAGVLGNADPVILSPQHRLLWQDPCAELFYGASQVLIPAKALCATPLLAEQAFTPLVRYVHLLCKGHELLNAGGLWAESLFVGDMLAQSVSPELGMMSPKFDPAPFLTQRAARQMLTMQEALRLTQRSAKSPSSNTLAPA